MATDDKNERRTSGLLSQSPVMAQLLKQVEQVAETNATMLVLGETGVGKSLLARTIHQMSPRHEQAFIPVNCGALSPGLIESELFGHEKGAFTGAGGRHIGCFERAHGGTLFLDEIGALPLESQQVLLHILEEDCLTRVGGRASTPVDVRIVAATNRDLQRAVREGAFRADLYYRLDVFSVMLPRLRERREDIPLLATHFVCEYARKLRRSVPTLSDEVLAYLQGYAWPGNVRELEHWIHRAMIVGEGERLGVADGLLAEREDQAGALEPPASAPAVPAVEVEGGGNWETQQAEVAKAEKQQIEAALRATKGRIYGEHGAARLLGMGPEKLRYYMRKYGVQRPKKSS